MKNTFLNGLLKTQNHPQKTKNAPLNGTPKTENQPQKKEIQSATAPRKTQKTLLKTKNPTFNYPP